MVISDAPKTATHPAKTANPKSGTVPTFAFFAAGIVDF